MRLLGRLGARENGARDGRGGSLFRIGARLHALTALISDQIGGVGRPSVSGGHFGSWYCVGQYCVVVVVVVVVTAPERCAGQRLKRTAKWGDEREQQERLGERLDFGCGGLGMSQWDGQVPALGTVFSLQSSTAQCYFSWRARRWLLAPKRRWRDCGTRCGLCRLLLESREAVVRRKQGLAL